MTSSDEEDVDDDSCAGDLQMWLQDDSNVKPSDRTQTMITLAHCCVDNFSTNMPPFNNKVFCQTTNLGWSWSSSVRDVMQQRLI